MKKLVLVLGVIIVGLIAFVMMIDLNTYKPKIEQLVRDTSGYDLKIDGDIGVSFSPIGISVNKVSVKSPGKETFASLGSFDVALELMPLMKKEIKVNYVTLSKLVLSIEKAKDGTFNFEVPAVSKEIKEVAKDTTASETKLPLINVTEVRLKDSNVNYKDLQTNSVATLENINVMINDIQLDSTKEKLQSIDFKGAVKIDTITYDKYKIKNTNVEFDMKDAIANITHMGYTIFDSTASGKARIDLHGINPKIVFEQNIPNLKLTNFSKEVLEKDLFDGLTNTDIKLSFVGGELKQIKETLSGSVSFDGKNILFKGYDLDKIAKTYNDTKDTKNINLGSILTTIGTVDVKGDTTAIEHLHVAIDIDKKIANLSDVAIATLKNRVALKGSVDIVNEKFIDVQVGLLEANGCAKYTQMIKGFFSNPSVKVDDDMVNTMVNLASSFFGKKENVAPKKSNESCREFYNGVIKHP